MLRCDCEKMQRRVVVKLGRCRGEGDPGGVCATTESSEEGRWEGSVQEEGD